MSSLIKDIDEDKLLNTKMVCIRGASLRNICDELNDLNSYNNITQLLLVDADRNRLMQIETDYNKVFKKRNAVGM